MARYEHLPIYKKAMDLTIYFEKIVRNFSRYHKYTLGSELREKEVGGMNQTRIHILFLFSMMIILMIFIGGKDVFAENIDSNDDGSQYAYGENVGWLNLEPGGDGGPGVDVGDFELTGYIWAENIGWISLSCENTSSCGTVDYGVTNDGSGNLSGYAWGENVGWINFSCENTGSCSTVDYGVTIDPATGEFSGKAWGENVGWISFKSSGPVFFGVTTSWRGLCKVAIVLGLDFPQGQGYMEVVEASPPYTHVDWVRVPWPDYNAAVGATNPCLCNLDDDPYDELVVGLEAYPTTGGYVEIRDDATTGYAHLTWIRVPWPAYNSANGATYPACGDFDGDGKNELAIGLGKYPTTGGYVEIRDDSTTGYAHQKWVRVPWPAYNSANGETRPAAGDFDGDGKDELAIGLGRYPTTGGYVEIRDDATTGFAHMAWPRVPWPAYNSSQGRTRPAAGDFDGDGKDELAIGLGTYTSTGGYVEIKDDATTGFAHMAWPRVPWPAYNRAYGATNPAAGDLDSDGKDELIIGLGTYPAKGGYVEIKDDDSTGYAHMDWMRVHWPTYNNANGETRPALGR